MSGFSAYGHVPGDGLFHPMAHFVPRAAIHHFKAAFAHKQAHGVPGQGEGVERYCRGAAGQKAFLPGGQDAFEHGFKAVFAAGRVLNAVGEIRGDRVDSFFGINVFAQCGVCLGQMQKRFTLPGAEPEERA